MRQYRNADMLDRDMLLKLIDRIEVDEVCMVVRQKEREIRIHCKFVGECPVSLLFSSILF